MAGEAHSRPVLRARHARHSAITGLGVYRPARAVTNAELVPRFDIDEDWIETRTGIRQRLAAGDHETLVAMAAAASVEALARADLAPDAVDAVLLATMTNVRQIPPLAPAIAHRIGAVNAGAYDINAACAGFSVGLVAAAGHIATANAEHVLVVAAERVTDVIDPNDRDTAVIFGDGAGAAVVSLADEPGFGPVVWGSDGTAEELFVLTPGSTDSHGRTAGKPVLRMNGPELARRFGHSMAPIAAEAMRRAGVTWDDLAAFIPHQANKRLTKLFVKALEPPPHVVVADAIEQDGNTSAASIPLAAEHLLTDGRATSGDLALVLGFGVGMSWAAQVVRLP